jgi:hypothetical protein
MNSSDFFKAKISLAKLLPFAYLRIHARRTPVFRVP